MIFGTHMTSHDSAVTGQTGCLWNKLDRQCTTATRHHWHHTTCQEAGAKKPTLNNKQTRSKGTLSLTCGKESAATKVGEIKVSMAGLSHMPQYSQLDHLENARERSNRQHCVTYTAFGKAQQVEVSDIPGSTLRLELDLGMAVYVSARCWLCPKQLARTIATFWHNCTHTTDNIPNDSSLVPADIVFS